MHGAACCGSLAATSACASHPPAWPASTRPTTQPSRMPRHPPTHPPTHPAHLQVGGAQLLPLVRRAVTVRHGARALRLVKGQLPVQRRRALQLRLVPLLRPPLGGLHLPQVLAHAVALRSRRRGRRARRRQVALCMVRWGGGGGGAWLPGCAGLQEMGAARKHPAGSEVPGEPGPTPLPAARSAPAASTRSCSTELELKVAPPSDRHIASRSRTKSSRSLCTAASAFCASRSWRRSSAVSPPAPAMAAVAAAPAAGAG